MIFTLSPYFSDPNSNFYKQARGLRCPVECMQCQEQLLIVLSRTITKYKGGPFKLFLNSRATLPSHPTCCFIILDQKKSCGRSGQKGTQLVKNELQIVWQYGLSSFTGRDTKLQQSTYLHYHCVPKKNQLSQKQLIMGFVFLYSRECQPVLF